MADTGALKAPARKGVRVRAPLPLLFAVTEVLICYRLDGASKSVDNVIARLHCQFPLPAWLLKML